jgi:myosin heavy subunit
MSQRILSSKVDILMEQRNYLQTCVDEMDKVLQMATSWLRNEDTTKSFTYSDMKKMIDDKLDFLVSTDLSVGCKEVTIEQEPVAARSFPSAPKSTDQPLPAGYVHVSGVTAASKELKTILSQVNGMQDAMSSLSTSSKMLSEKQLAMEKLVESLPDQFSKVEQEKLREIERELESIKEENKNVVFQQDKRMTSFEDKIQAVTDTQSDIIENCHQQQIKIKDHKEETEKLKTQSQQFTKDLNDLSENVLELFAEICVLENNASTNTQSDDLEGEVKSLKGSLEELSTRFEEHGSSLEELTKINEETLKVLTSVQESESQTLQNLEEKISALENSWSETTVENGKLCQDVKTKFDDACGQTADLLPKFSRFEEQTHKLFLPKQRKGTNKTRWQKYS